MRRRFALVALLLSIVAQAPAAALAQRGGERVRSDAPRSEASEQPPPYDGAAEEVPRGEAQYDELPEGGPYRGRMYREGSVPSEADDAGPYFDGPDEGPYGEGPYDDGPYGEEGWYEGESFGPRFGRACAGPGDPYCDPYYDRPRYGRGIIDFLFHPERDLGNCCNDKCCPWYWQHRTGLFGELMYLRPRDVEVAYAVPVDGPVAAVNGNGIQIGPTALVDPDYSAGFRVGFAYALDCESSLAGTYWNLRTNTTDDISIDAPDVIRSLVSHPLGANAATDVLAANAELDVDFDIVDADYRAIIWCEPRWVVNGVLGARYGQLTQDFRSSFSRNGVTQVNTDLDFDGGGIRLGLDGQRAFRRPGWAAYGKATANFLGGEFRGKYQQIDAFQQTVVDTDWSSGRIVTILDLELGVVWIGPSGRFRFQAGYLASSWLNAVATDEFIKSVQANDFTHLGDTITFDGLTARVEFRF